MGLKDNLQSCIRACNDLKTVLYVAGSQQSGYLATETLAARTLQAELNSKLRIQLWHSVVVNLLESRLSERLQELDYIVHRAHVSPDIDHVRVHRADHEGGSVMVEFKRNRLMPFDADQTSRTVWRLLSLGVMPDDRYVRVTKHSDGMLLSQGCVSRSLDYGGSVELRASCLIKRVVIPAGFVVLIESTTEWQARPSRAKAWSHVTRDSGWALVHPSGLMPGTCRVETAVRVQSNDPATEPSAQQNAVTQLTPRVSDVVIPSFRGIMASQHQLLENTLLDSARAATC